MKLVTHFLVVAATMLVLAQQLPGFHVSGIGPAILAAVVLAFANAVLRPILFLLTLPFTLLTLGGFLLVLNVAMLWVTQLVVPGFDIVGLRALVIGSLLVSIVSLVWKWIVPEERDKGAKKKHDKHAKGGQDA